MAVVTGPGGPSISAADAAEEAGLQLTAFGAQTIDRLRSEIAAVGTSPRNPVDVGLIMYGPTDVYARVTEIVVSDPTSMASSSSAGAGRAKARNSSRS